MTVDELLERISARELTEWGLLFELKNEEYEAAKHGEAIEMGQRPDAGPSGDDDEDDEDEGEDG